jgi:hypothetical protein
MPNMVCKLVGRLVISIHTVDNPTNEEWGEMVRLAKQWSDKARGLSFTDGGAPSSTQRRQTNDALGGRTVRTAVVTPSAVARGVVTAMSWFNSELKAFAPGDLKAALRYLDVTDSEHELIRVETRRLVSQFGTQRIMSVPNDL